MEKPSITRPTPWPALNRAWVVLALLGLLAGLPSASGQDGRTLLDWNMQTPDMPIQPTLLPNEVHFRHTGSSHRRTVDTAKVLDANTEPASPFENGTHCLLVRQTHEDSRHVNLRIKPFLDMSAPAQGWIDFDFALTEGSMTFHFGALSDPTTLPSLAYEGQQVLRVRFEPGERSSARLELGGQRSGVRLNTAIEPQVPVRFRIEWDVEGASPGLRFYRDGEAIKDDKGNPAVLPLPEGALTEGLDHMTTTISEGIMGNVRASQ